ncbi:MAG: hypothetical protein CME62_08450 [Halobacteriovoraceae bacterium]|nr:hypothetical protein [Halobacteriovoraceae bacterium]|tara:strand:- start:6673 stop:8067 length:1395 start_codon:yes stop_codon:yes gene_type:complete
MKQFLILISFLFVYYSTAGIEQAPPNFKVRDKQAVFVDFRRAQYNITFDVQNHRALVETKILFEQKQKGYPLFDLVNRPLSVTIHDKEVEVSLIKTPGDASKLRMIEKELPKGIHQVIIHSEIENGTRFSTNDRKPDWGNVSSGFFIRDLRDRMFLEKYLPTNYEYDQYRMEIDVKVTGTKRWHSLFTNGEKTKVSENHYRVRYPDFYTASSLYFHLVPINRFVRYYLTYPSIDGRDIPVTIYSNYRFYNYLAKKKAWKVMRELEADYGAYPHDQLIIYGTGLRGGMEHAGATETSIVSLGHELFHFYFAKGVHPANGNSGWLDEALASWRDKGYQTVDLPFYDSANLAAHNLYTRKTDKRSYEYGRSFMGYLDKQLKEIGKPGLKDFLRVFFAKRKLTTVTTEDFKSDLEEYAQMSFQADFFQYIYGGHMPPESGHKHVDHDHGGEENPHHPARTEAEMLSIL